MVYKLNYRVFVPKHLFKVALTVFHAWVEATAINTILIGDTHFNIELWNFVWKLCGILCILRSFNVLKIFALCVKREEEGGI